MWPLFFELLSKSLKLLIKLMIEQQFFFFYYLNIIFCSNLRVSLIYYYVVHVHWIPAICVPLVKISLLQCLKTIESLVLVLLLPHLSNQYMVTWDFYSKAGSFIRLVRWNESHNNQFTCVNFIMYFGLRIILRVVFHYNWYLSTMCKDFWMQWSGKLTL